MPAEQATSTHIPATRVTLALMWHLGVAQSVLSPRDLDAAKSAVLRAYPEGEGIRVVAQTRRGGLIIP